MRYRRALVSTIAAIGMIASAQAAGADLLANGDFEAGDAGFTSGHVRSAGDLLPEGVYDIVTDPSNVQPFADSFGDHTTGFGQMMAINGATVSGVLVWSETVTVSPQTDYMFTGWIVSWDPSPPIIPAKLQIKVNGVEIGLVTAPMPTAVWQPFEADWSSVGDTSATIEIFNLETSETGNDFALDDLAFVPEPGSFAMFVAAGVGLFLRRRALHAISRAEKVEQKRCQSRKGVRNLRMSRRRFRGIFEAWDDPFALIWRVPGRPARWGGTGGDEAQDPVNPRPSRRPKKVKGIV